MSNVSLNELKSAMYNDYFYESVWRNKDEGVLNALIYTANYNDVHSITLLYLKEGNSVWLCN